MTSKLFLTEEDRNILLHVEKYGSITINQCQDMYYSRQIRGYEMARLHLTKLCKHEKISVSKDEYSNKNVYYMDNKPTYHGILILDYYSKLVKAGATINYFKQGQSWMNGKYKSAAYCNYSLEENTFADIAEVVKNRTIDINKYKEIFNSGEVTEANPRLIIIDDVQHSNPVFINEEVKVIQLDFQLNDFTKIFLK